MINFSVEGIPKSRQGIKTTVRKNQVGKHFAMHYHPSGDPASLWLERVLVEAQQHRLPELITGPLCLKLTFRILRLKSHPRKRVYPTHKPDLKALAWAIEDLLQGIIYKNDSQVVHQDFRKVFTDNNPGVNIGIMEME